MNSEERAEIAASVAAHAELGPHYDAAVAEGLIERIGEEIDRRVNARLRAAERPGAAARPGATAPGTGHAAEAATGQAPPAAAAATGSGPAAQRRGYGITSMILGLGSIGLGVGATAAVVSHHAAAVAQVIMIALIWAAIAVINTSHAQRH